MGGIQFLHRPAARELPVDSQGPEGHARLPQHIDIQHVHAARWGNAVHVRHVADEEGVDLGAGEVAGADEHRAG